MIEPKSPYSITYTKKDWELGDEKWKEFVESVSEFQQRKYKELHPNIIT